VLNGIVVNIYSANYGWASTAIRLSQIYHKFERFKRVGCGIGTELEINVWMRTILLR
jgi:hypothetical protein